MGEYVIPPHLQVLLDDTKCVYRRLGNSGLKISVPILGAMGIGDKRWIWPWIVEEEQALAILKRAWDRGITTWDTSNIFSNGVSEEIIGKAIKKFDIPRHKLIIMTKCFATVGEDIENIMGHSLAMKRTKAYVNQSGLSRHAIFTAVERSLERLGVDYIDIFQIHRCDSSTPYEETMEALHDLIRSGKVRYIGASSMWTYQFAQYQFAAERRGWTKFISMQNFYNVLYREEEREMIKFCQETGVGIISFMPLCRGLLARPIEETLNGSTERARYELKNPSRYPAGTTELDHTIIRRVEEVAKNKDWPMTDVALAWVNKRITSPVIGFTSPEQVDGIFGFIDKELTPEEETYLEELYQPKTTQAFR